MPEFYHGTACNYQKRAQPFLDAIARGFKTRKAVRNFLLEGTPHDASYIDANPIWEEQWKMRDPSVTGHFSTLFHFAAA